MTIFIRVVACFALAALGAMAAAGAYTELRRVPDQS
jgi:hypothetical protein